MALFTMMMDTCREESHATDYTLQASIVVLITGSGAASSGFFAQSFGYSTVFAIGAIFSLAGTCAIAMLLPRAQQGLSSI